MEHSDAISKEELNKAFEVVKAGIKEHEAKLEQLKGMLELLEAFNKGLFKGQNVEVL